MKNVMMVPVLFMALSAAGCATIQWEVGGSCSTSGECKVEGKIKGSSESQQRFVNRVFASGMAFDAAQFTINVGSAATRVPNEGLVTLSLVDSSTAAVQASQVFVWVKTGAGLMLQDPDAVNDWALTYGGTADEVAYEMHPFVVSSEEGNNILVVSSQYEGATTASATMSWRYNGGGCSVGHCAEN